MSLPSPIRFVSLLTLPLLLAGNAQAHWELANSDSTLSFVTIKADNVAEVHTFDQLSGSVGDDGSLEVVIELASVNTLIPIRDERMQNLLFETGMFPQAKVTGTVDLSSVTALAVGSSTRMSVQFNLNLHAQSNLLNADVLVTRLADGFTVTTVKPLIVNAEPFGLSAGVEALREIAGLSRISLAVPTSFTVVFRQH